MLGPLNSLLWYVPSYDDHHRERVGIHLARSIAMGRNSNVLRVGAESCCLERQRVMQEKLSAGEKHPADSSMQTKQLKTSVLAFLQGQSKRSYGPTLAFAAGR